MSIVAEPFSAWAFLELMGHRKLVGLVKETEIAGSKFLRIDALDREGKQVTQWYSPGAVYCITPTDEPTARAWAQAHYAAPVDPLALLAPLKDQEGTAWGRIMGEDQ